MCVGKIHDDITPPLSGILLHFLQDIPHASCMQEALSPPQKNPKPSQTSCHQYSDFFSCHQFTSQKKSDKDFFLREARAVVTGPMAVVRLGTCGCLQESVFLGPVGRLDIHKTPDDLQNQQNKRHLQQNLQRSQMT